MAIAIIKIHSSEDVKQPAKVKRYLPLLRRAFAIPRLIQRPIDKEPKVTLILLEHLSREVSNSEIRAEVAVLKSQLQTRK